MEEPKLVLRVCTAALFCAICFRLVTGGIFTPVMEVLSSPQTASFLLYLETGRILRPTPEETEPAPTLPEVTAPAALPKPVFTAEDLPLVSIRYQCSYEPDVEALLTQPLSWDLTGEEPTVLILHTHATESYTQTPDASYEESSSYRTLDERYNMVSIGAAVASALEAGGLRVIHDTTYHDYPSYSGSYATARDTISQYLSQYPSIQLVLDLHRDAAELADGSQMTTSATADGSPSAQLMLVMGSDAGGLTYPNWQENLSLALKLQAQLERENPGICRSINFCASRYNQDLLPGALLVEIGAAGNTHTEALTAANALAEGILSLAHGTAP